jgi:hypothetical protein
VSLKPEIAMSEQDVLSLAQAAAKPRRLERRAWVRYPCNLPSACQVAESEEDTFLCTATVADLSIIGASLVVLRHFEPGALVAVALWNTRQTFRCPRQARVVRAAEMPGGRWLLGCEFTPPLGEDELRKLLT